MRKRSAWVLAAAVASAAACGGGSAQMPGAKGAESLAQSRSAGRGSSDGERVGRWLLAELLAPGGDAAEAKKARAQIDVASHDGLYASLARGMYDEGHGAPRTAADAYVAVLTASRSSDDALAPLASLFAVHKLLGLRAAVNELYAQHKPALDKVLASPGRVGWRAAIELADWSAREAFDKAEATGSKYDELVTSREGCAKGVSIAGPFGHGSTVDRHRSFAAEAPSPWPAAWPRDGLRGSLPHVLKVEQPRCLASGSEKVEPGVFYARVFFDAPNERDVLVAVTGAVKVWIDDAPVLERYSTDWGAWQRFGAAAHVGPGRHRVLARLVDDSATVRILNPDGTPSGLATTGDARGGYSIVPPTLLASPNPIDEIVHAQKAGSPLEAALAGYAAHIDGLDDVATVLTDPITTPTNAAATALEEAALFADDDAAMPEDVRRRTQRDLYVRARDRDGGLWYPPAWILLDDAEQKGLVDAVEAVRTLADRFSAEPELLEQLSRLYARLNWTGERMRALADLAKRFPDDVNALRLYLEVLDEQGPAGEADQVARRIEKLEPDAEVELDRALARHDWKSAIAQLERLQKRRPDRKEIASRIADVLSRAGDPSSAATQLSKALAKDPLDATARFRLADQQYAKGDVASLRRALADALAVGAKTTELRDAIDLLEGATALEPWRLDGRKQIKEFEAWEKAGHHMDGNAARILDYGATWIHPDGSSSMLEHEILRIQSQEEIGKESEQQPPTGLVLHLRVLKPDGTMLEPEPVSGKPTYTMPHLEVGDYLEIEHVTPEAGDGQRGRRYRGPTWFFREADKGYWRSRFVVIAPKDKPLEIESRGGAPKPAMRAVGPTFVERSWLVEDSPPAPEEPESAPITEYLPSVRVGWGVNVDDTVARLVDAAKDETPLDPRLRARALEIAGGAPASAKDARAKLAYDWVLANIQPGKEDDGRKVIFGKSGSLQSAFQHLMRQLGIPVDAAIVKDRLAAPSVGSMSEVETYDSLALRVATEKGPRWLTVHDKFAPFGYVPAEQRGQPCIVLVDGTPHDRVTSTGSTDGLAFEGRADLRPDGSAAMDLVESFSGKVGIQMRNALDRIPEGQLHDAIEAHIVGRNLPGAHLRDMKIENKADLAAPLVVRMHLEVPSLARVQEGKLVLASLFPMRLAHLATLPSRQTPLLLSTWSHFDVKVEIVVPESMKLPASLPTGDLRDGERVVSVHDAVHGRSLQLVRVVDIPAGRVQPAEYAQFQKFAQDADAMLEREIAIGK